LNFGLEADNRAMANDEALTRFAKPTRCSKVISSFVAAFTAGNSSERARVAANADRRKVRLRTGANGLTARATVISPGR